MYINDCEGGQWGLPQGGGVSLIPKERQWPSGSGSDAMQSNGAARKIYKNTSTHSHTHRGHIQAAAADGHTCSQEQGAKGHRQLATHAKILPREAVPSPLPRDAGSIRNRGPRTRTSSCQRSSSVQLRRLSLVASQAQEPEQPEESPHAHS